MNTIRRKDAPFVYVVVVVRVVVVRVVIVRVVVVVGRVVVVAVCGSMDGSTEAPNDGRHVLCFASVDVLCALMPAPIDERAAL